MSKNVYRLKLCISFAIAHWAYSLAFCLCKCWSNICNHRHWCQMCDDASAPLLVPWIPCSLLCAWTKLLTIMLFWVQRYEKSHIPALGGSTSCIADGGIRHPLSYGPCSVLQYDDDMIILLRAELSDAAWLKEVLDLFYAATATGLKINFQKSTVTPSHPSSQLTAIFLGGRQPSSAVLEE